MSIPSDREIAKVMHETGMGRMQGIRHLQAREELLRRGFGVRQKPVDRHAPEIRDNHERIDP